MYLFFIESSNKKKTIKSFLGKEYVIFATNGHFLEITNEGQYNLGVNFNDFSVSYKPFDNKKNLIQSWKKFIDENKPTKILIGTDKDREGEMIANHIKESLGLKEEQYDRLLFHEITGNAIRESLQNPVKIDQNLVKAQLARSVLDRMIGFCVSDLLKKKVNGISAGRIQSVVLKLIVDKEREIKEYGDKKEFTISADLKISEVKYRLPEVDSDNKSVIYDSSEKAEVKKDSFSNTFHLKEIAETKEKFIFPSKPLTTSSLLIEAKKVLGFSIHKTTALAKNLFEGVSFKSWKPVRGSLKTVSLITYPRTDSHRFSKSFSFSAYDYIKNNYGKDYCNFKDNSSSNKSSKGNVQDAHEAIRPVYIEGYTPSNLENELDKDLFNLYSLIFRYSIASLMNPLRFSSTEYFFSNNGSNFRLTDNVSVFDGFSVIFDDHRYQKANNINKVSPITVDQISSINGKVEVNEYTWNLPRRYTESAIVRKLELLGIGRPSTYNIFSRIIVTRGYCVVDKAGKFSPTDLGLRVNSWLQENFGNLINERYTASLEESLDKISTGKDSYLSFISNFWKEFLENYKRVGG